MSLPAPLLLAAEQHHCFTGVFGYESEASVCLGGDRPLASMIVIRCDDCLSWHVGALRDQLPRFIRSAHDLADALTDHVRRKRGFQWAISGYHPEPQGYWLSAVCLSPGTFLVDSNRSFAADPVRALLRASHDGVVPSFEPAMRDPGRYSCRDVFVNFAGMRGPIRDASDLLASGYGRPTAQGRYRRVSLVEYADRSRYRQPGEPADLKERPLFENVSIVLGY